MVTVWYHVSVYCSAVAPGFSCRKIMDSGELDFYQHSRLCSNTCRSTKIDLVGSRVSLSSQQSIETAPATPASVDGVNSQNEPGQFMHRLSHFFLLHIRMFFHDGSTERFEQWLIICIYVSVNGSSASISEDAGDDSTEWVTAIGGERLCDVL